MTAPISISCHKNYLFIEYDRDFCDNSPALVGHTGGTAGASAFFAMSPAGKYMIIILSNVSNATPLVLYKNVRKTMGFSDNVINY
jgi:hypothetical protein